MPIFLEIMKSLAEDTFRQPFFAANCKTYAENNVPSSKNIHSFISQTFFIASSSIE